MFLPDFQYIWEHTKINKSYQLIDIASQSFNFISEIVVSLVLFITFCVPHYWWHSVEKMIRIIYIYRTYFMVFFSGAHFVRIFVCQKTRMSEIILSENQNVRICFWPTISLFWIEIFNFNLDFDMYNMSAIFCKQFKFLKQIWLF